MAKEITYTCSGGPMGGEQVAVNDKCPLDKATGEQRVDIAYEDDAGKCTLQYNVRAHDPNSDEKVLIYIGRTPAEK